MRRSALLRLALRSYPSELRGDIGREMLDTASEASSGSLIALLGEAAGLVGNGLRSRARSVLSIGAARLIADGTCLAGTWWLALILAGELVVWSTGAPSAHQMWWRTSIAVAAFALALGGHDRAAGLLGLARMILHSRWTGLELVISAEVLLSALPVVFLSVMVWRPRQRVFRKRSLLWLCAPLLIAPLTVPQRILPLHGAGAIFMALVVLAAALAVAFDPRLAIACVLIAAELGVVLQRYASDGAQHPIGIGMIAMAPIALGFTAVRARQVPRTRAP
jgi:hypothetical protein